MASLRTLTSGMLLSLLPACASAQISEDIQSNLERIALATLNTSESIPEIAYASELLVDLGSSSASDANFKGVTCKRVAKMLYREDLESES